jgi:NAD(P)-dependent dehydrogenase (short-subunit alcohol dehydrogenase family)
MPDGRYGRRQVIGVGTADVLATYRLRVESFEKRVAVVTGAASGIGRALAGAFAAEGCRVVLADADAVALDDAAVQLRDAGAEALAVATDVSDADAVDELAQRALDTFGAVHILCNNAGVTWRSRIAETALEDWCFVLGVNLGGVIHGLHAFLPTLMVQDDAHVVNTASITGLDPGPFSAVYATSKAGVIALSEVLYKEMLLSAPHVGVSVLCPGGVRTNIGVNSRARREELAPETSSPDVAALLDELNRVNPQARTVRDAMATAVPPEDVATVVLEAIRARRFWVLSHPEFNPYISQRTEDMVAGRSPRPGHQG